MFLFSYSFIGASLSANSGPLYHFFHSSFTAPCCKVFIIIIIIIIWWVGLVCKDVRNYLCVFVRGDGESVKGGVGDRVKGGVGDRVRVMG